MAILERMTNYYYKLNYDRCTIDNNFVYVSATVYRDEENRRKEQSREEDIQKFFAEINTRLEANREELSEEQLEEIEELDRWEYIIKNNYKVREIVQIDIPQSVRINLISLGFVEDWITDPIVTVGTLTINCGSYNNEDTTYEYYYSCLKRNMSDNIDNV